MMLTKIAAAFVTAAVVFSCQSCAIPSVYAVAPSAPPADVDWATGTWNFTPGSPTDKDQSGYTATIEKVGGGRYLIDWKPTTNAGSPDLPPLKLVARPFELGGRLFADVKLQTGLVQELSKKYPGFLIPTHVLARIDRDPSGNATLSLPVYTKARELAEAQKRPLPMVMSESDQDVALAITSDSESVTMFYEANAANEQLFAFKLKFVKAAAAPASAPKGR